MAEEPDEAGGSTEGEEAKPWPVVSRSMINYDDAMLQVGRDIYVRYRKFGPVWPGRVLALAGLALAGIAFAGWVAILTRFWRDPERPSFAEVSGPELPSGLSVGVVHAVAFVVGALLVLSGAAMSRSWIRTWVQILIVLLLITAALVLVMLALGGAPLTVLLPDFSP